MTDEPFFVEVTISAPVEEVWEALRDTEQLRRWHGWHCDELDKEIEFIYHRDVVESAAEYRLEVQGGDRFELADLGGRTRLRLTRPPRGSNPESSEWELYYDDMTEGWITFVHQLRFALERHPGADRRTVFLSGGGGGPVLRAAGLTAAAGSAPGSPYELEGPAGERLRGEVWFRSERQLGLTVAGWGDGLLVAVQNPVPPGKPESGAMMVLTAYDLDDAAFSDLQARWTAWWNRTFETGPAEA
ncbi:SRPBCC family protein [Planobispora takensis]|uniref:SRPBCC family protein n=1 Tax=Planobispora takensis TaxID=1367882 RepID=UPI00194210E7|nr:SRPBCC domain-containing protein [Planobispora takensis]